MSKKLIKSHDELCKIILDLKNIVHSFENNLDGEYREALKNVIEKLEDDREKLEILIRNN